MIQKHVEDLVNELQPGQYESAFGIFMSALLRVWREDPWYDLSHQAADEVRQHLRKLKEEGKVRVYYAEDITNKERASMVFTIYEKVEAPHSTLRPNAIRVLEN